MKLSTQMSGLNDGIYSV